MRKPNDAVAIRHGIFWNGRTGIFNIRSSGTGGTEHGKWINIRCNAKPSKLESQTKKTLAMMMMMIFAEKRQNRRIFGLLAFFSTAYCGLGEKD